jgi:hypothetical protein
MSASGVTVAAYADRPKLCAVSAYYRDLYLDVRGEVSTLAMVAGAYGLHGVPLVQAINVINLIRIGVQNAGNSA